MYLFVFEDIILTSCITLKHSYTFFLPNNGPPYIMAYGTSLVANFVSNCYEYCPTSYTFAAAKLYI